MGGSNSSQIQLEEYMDNVTAFDPVVREAIRAAQAEYGCPYSDPEKARIWMEGYLAGLNKSSQQFAMISEALRIK